MTDIELKFKGYEGYRLVRKWIGDTIKQMLPTDYAGIEIALNEAINNAIKHGNEGRPDKRVAFRLKCIDNKRIIIRVKDEGKGFRQVHGSDGVPCMSKDSGRGIFIMRHFADRIYYNKQGNEVMLVKNNSLDPVSSKKQLITQGGTL
ncbi:ATP-binding protein [Ammoniphilus sp. YIM 78166]|uniref:ATP-binding protein n=1 Tax=Ammoniphilus sp. YIM 78166 TaxID=1644106 RepID=UPI00106F0D5E|nr:ATP-binding protein [Ammoniphilus sp. YIM 78166]